MERDFIAETLKALEVNHDVIRATAEKLNKEVLEMKAANRATEQKRGADASYWNGLENALRSSIDHLRCIKNRLEEEQAERAS